MDEYIKFNVSLLAEVEYKIVILFAYFLLVCFFCSGMSM